MGLSAGVGFSVSAVGWAATVSDPSHSPNHAASQTMALDFQNLGFMG
jgi:hypothetical protein